MKRLLAYNLLILLLTFYAKETGAQKFSIEGRLLDQEDGTAVERATVLLKEPNQFVLSDAEGRFVFANAASGTYTLVIHHSAYHERILRIRITGQAEILVVHLERKITSAETVVVSASRYQQKLVEAPAFIQVLTQKEISRFAGSNTWELLSHLPGIQFSRTGMDFVAINARGPNNAINNRTFQLVDGRNNMSAISVGLPLTNNSSVNKEDIASIEVVMGPQAALYGPNVYNALVSVHTKDPRIYPGTSAALTVGNRNQFSTRFRHAQAMASGWAFKVTAEYVKGLDFPFLDSVYVGGGPNNVYGPRIAVPERNVNRWFSHKRSEAQLSFETRSGMELMAAGGYAENDFIGVSTAGRNQMRDHQNVLLHFRAKTKKAALNIYKNWGDLGNSYAISSYTRDYHNRTNSSSQNDPVTGRLSPAEAEIFALRPGNRFREKSRRLNADFFYKWAPVEQSVLAFGLNYQLELPRTFGLTLADGEKRIVVQQSGVSVLAEKDILPGTRIIFAARLDHHSNYDFQFSPRIALTREAGKGLARLTWARAYALPSIYFQFANLGGSVFGNGNGISYIPNLTSVKNTSTYQVTQPLVPEEISAFEAGYKSALSSKVFIDVALHYARRRNFQSSAQRVEGRPLAMGEYPLTAANPGTVNNDTLYNAFFNTFFNFGKVHTYGVDLVAGLALNRNMDLQLSYSWLGSDIGKGRLYNDANKDGFITEDEKSLNSPAHTGTINFTCKNLLKAGSFIQVKNRFVESFDFYSGNQTGTRKGKGSRGKQEPAPGIAPILKNFDWGPLGGFISTDLQAGYVFTTNLSVNFSVTNLFNVRQVEFVGSPSIGRLMMLELRVQLH